MLQMKYLSKKHASCLNSVYEKIREGNLSCYILITDRQTDRQFDKCNPQILVTRKWNK